MEQYLKVLKSYKRFPKGVEECLAANIQRFVLPKGSIIEKETFDGHMYFIERGLIARTKKTGKKFFVSHFKKENDFIIDYRKDDEFTGMRDYNLVVLEDTVIWVIPEKTTEYLERNFPVFIEHSTIITRKDWVLSEDWSRFYSMGSVDAWIDFIRSTSPDLLERAPIKYLAAYMQTTERILRHMLKRNVRVKMPMKRH